jgi:hypothetical protein
MQGRKLLMTALATGLGLTAYGREKPKISRVTAERTSPAAGPAQFARLLCGARRCRIQAEEGWACC